MKLVIVESPHKAKTISKYLGKDYVILASGGHINDLPEKRLGIDIEHDFKPEYEVNPDKAAVIDKLKKEVKKSDEVFLATDPDREGEAISWHLKNVLKVPGRKNRIEFNEISKKAITKALESPREINMNRVDSQQARRVLDRLVGYKVSPILSKKIRSGLSAGRVQSVALKMIVDREREIKAFKPEEYWNIFAFNHRNEKGQVFKSAFNDIDGKKTKVRNKEENDAIVEASKKGDWYVESVKRAQSLSKPNPPFTTSTMQQDASAKLGLSAAQVMKTAQQLYEGVTVSGEGQVALVTYIRTDSVRISDDAAEQAKQYIEGKYGKEYAPEKKNVYSTKGNAQDAHEAIRPITLERTPEELKDKIDRNSYRLYKLIFDRFVASQMKNALYDTLTVHIISKSDKKYGYMLKGKTLKFAGYTAVYNAYAEEKEEDPAETGMLPNFDEGEKLLLKEIKSEQKFTKPPARFTEATLVKGMEESGIGRPSTYASIIMVITKRKYVEKDGKTLMPTELGEIVTDQLVQYFPDIMNTGFTADMEAKLDKIEDGDVKWQNVLKDFYPGFEKELTAAASDGKKVKLTAVETDVICEKCGSKMVIKEGRYGKFLACPRFPECRNIKSYGEPVSTCPKCGKGIVEKRSKKGKLFYSCTGYPDCDFISWDIPAPYFCPDCGETMKIVKDGGKKAYLCTNRGCKHKEVVESGSTAEEQAE